MAEKKATNNNKKTNTDTVKRKVRELPHSLEAEQALLGCILLDTKIQVEVSAYLKEEDFYAETHKYIFTAMDELIKTNRPVDFVTLTDALDKAGTLEMSGGIEYITELANSIPSVAGYQRYLSIVKRDSMLRRLIRGATEIIKECENSTDEKNSLALAEKKIYDISNLADTSELVKINSIIPPVMVKLDELSTDKSKFRGIKTMYRGIDALLNGFHESDLMVLAARPGMGKTSLGMNIVENIAAQGYTCAVFSLEMSKEQLVQRMLCSVAEINMGNAVRGLMAKNEWVQIARAQKVLTVSNIYIDDSAMTTPSEILSKCRRLKRKKGLDFIMVDYIQLMSPDKEKKDANRQQEVSDISRMLKILAKELNVPVLALSQLSRASESEKRRPQLSDLRESGAIEQDADIVMFIHRPDKSASDKELATGTIKPNVAELIVAKHRNGPQGTIKLYFKGECTKFLTLNEDTGEPEKQEQIKQTKLTGYADLPREEFAKKETTTNVQEEGTVVETESEQDFSKIVKDTTNNTKSIDDEIF